MTTAPQENSPPAAQPLPATGENPVSRDGKVIDLFDTHITFDQLGLTGHVLQGLKENGFAHPTKIQTKLIPPILAGKDVLGQARTGTGKTGAFGLPLLQMVDKGVPYQALVLVPTRELCVQVSQDINDLAIHTPLNSVAVYGGQRIQQQADALKRGAQIVVSTPGRLMDMIERRFLHLSNVKFAVLDEVDRMLDIGFRDDIRKILGMCPKQRQTIFVSATMPPDVERLARTYSREPEKIIATIAGALTTETVKQYYLPVQQHDKKRLVAHLLTHETPDLTVIFCRTKRMVDELARYLSDKGIDTHAMHGDMAQGKRNRVIEHLHKGTLSVLVASDLASRGLDVQGISHVINYDMPEDPEAYVHRIGRTARIGREGVAWSLVTPEQGELLTNIENLINKEIPRLEYPDFKASPPRERRDAPPPRPANQTNRYTASIAPTVPAAATPAQVNQNKFPGGIVPSKLPPNRMFGRVKTSRSMRDDPGTPPPAAPSTESPKA
ncbi:MAG: DEAD/DEAH box helicase [Phycisphaerales bacterium]